MLPVRLSYQECIPKVPLWLGRSYVPCRCSESVLNKHVHVFTLVHMSLQKSEVGFALLLVVFLSWFACCLVSLVLLGLFCLLRVTQKSEREKPQLLGCTQWISSQALPEAHIVQPLVVGAWTMAGANIPKTWRQVFHMPPWPGAWLLSLLQQRMHLPPIVHKSTNHETWQSTRADKHRCYGMRFGLGECLASGAPSLVVTKE